MISKLMILRRKFLLVFFTITLLSTSLSGCVTGITEPNKRIVELDMVSDHRPVITMKDTLRIFLPTRSADAYFGDMGRPPWNIAILVPQPRDHWLVIHSNYEEQIYLLSEEEYLIAPYIDISIADIEGIICCGHPHRKEKVFQELGEYRINIIDSLYGISAKYYQFNDHVILK